MDHKFKFKYKLMLLKAYFDTGYGVTSYLKWFIAFYGISSLNVKFTMALAVSYVFFCLIVGYYFYKWGFALAAAEVGNQFNLFQKEVREALESKKFK